MANRFDEIINRRGTLSLKYDFAVQRGKPEGILPLWVADMDFQTPPEVREALARSAEHGIFGYSESGREYEDILINWFKTRLDWTVDRKWLVKTPGVVYAIALAIRAFTQEGDAVMIQKPVYYPFSHVILDNDRKLVNNALVYQNGSYSVDLDDFEKKIVNNDVKLFILCSPHNPVGRVWTREELTGMGDICMKHGVIVVSDEIHADFIYPGNTHHVFSKLKPEYQVRSIICTAPSKTFNLAGLQVSNIVIGDSVIRKKFIKEIHKTGYSQLNTMGLVATQAAYQYGAPWLEDLLDYLIGNLNFLRDFLKERLPQIRLVEPQGTYLVWLDFRALGLSQDALDELLVTKANLWLDGGTMFGEEGTGFQRINIACPRAILEKAMLQLESAIKAH
jgi:cystathionine beta-lyase